MDLQRPSTSGLVRRLKDAAQAKPRAIGFGRERDGDRPAPTMVLVAEVAGLDAEMARQARASGAASLLFDVDAAAAARLASDGAGVKALLSDLGDAVAGAAVGSDGWQVAGLIPALVGAGFDYVVANVDGAPATLLTTDGLARVARVDEAAQTSGLLRALGDLQVDAILAGRTKPALATSALSLLDLMSYRHVIECVRQPVLIVADASIQPEDLQALRDLGVVGIVVPAADGARLQGFADAIARVKGSRPAGSGGPAVVLPRLAIGQSREAEHDDDEDDE